MPISEKAFERMIFIFKVNSVVHKKRKTRKEKKAQGTQISPERQRRSDGM